MLEQNRGSAPAAGSRRDAPMLARLDDTLSALDDAEGLTTMQRLRLTRELAGIRTDLGAGPSTMARLKLARRLAEVRAQLGAASKPAGGDGNDGADDRANFGLQASGIKTRERLNAQVREIIARIADTGVKAAAMSAADRAVLMQYSGRGGLTDNSQSEYYTPPHVASGTWDMLAANGFTNGNVLEPSTGAGVFSATKPAGVLISGAEIDPTSSAVAQLLHPEDKITNTSFERFALGVADNTFDAVNGNVPFGVRGKESHHDAAYKGEKRMERYFVRRVLDKVRPGGLVTLIVPTSVIGKKDKGWARWRADLSTVAEFLGGHKLPSKTFGKQGTDVVTDIIVLRKHPQSLLDKVGKIPVSTLTAANVLWAEFIEGRYWQGEGRRFIHGEFVPGDPNAARSEDKVIAPPDMDDAGLRLRLAAKFDSRIDWEALDAVQEVARAYAEGDRKVINGQSMELRGGQWVPFEPTAESETVLDSAAFGVASLAELEALLTTSDGMLSLTSDQAYKAWKRFPHLFNGVQSQAVEFAMSQPADKYREVAYRGSLLGALVSKYAMGDDATDRGRIIGLLMAEQVKYGHPSTIGGMVLDGAKAKSFGAYLSAIDSAGNVSENVRGDAVKAQGFDAGNILSIFTHLQRQSGDAIDVPAIAAIYSGPRKLVALGDIADVDGIAITAGGDVMTTGVYCCGDVYSKVADLQNASVGATDERLKAHWTGLINLMMGKVKRSDISSLSMSLRDNWIDPAYKSEFLRLNGYQDVTYSGSESDDFEDEDGASSASRTGGAWIYRGKVEFKKQLTHYLAGKSIGHNLKDRSDASAAERKAEHQATIQTLEEQFKFFMQSHQNGADLAATYDMTFNRHVTPEYDDSPLGLRGVSANVKTHAYQNIGVRRLSDEGSGILGYDVGLGKATPLYEPVLTPDGWKRMGDIEVGDMVIARDGRPTAVVGVFPQGIKPSYKVTFHDGASVECCDEHLWFTSTETDRARVNRYRRQGKAETLRGSVKTLREIMGTLRNGKSNKNHGIPMVEPVQHPHRKLPVHPYLLGVMIGDGSLSSGPVTVTKPDGWMHARVCDLARATMPGVTVAVFEPEDRCSGIRFSSAVKPILEPTGLMGTHSWDKFIPDAYMVSSVQQRIDMLRGLMDSDGWVSEDGAIVQFTSTSRKLADQVRDLAMSLGASAWVTSKLPKFSYKGEKKTGREAYTVGLRMPPAINPFAMPRKADRWRPNEKYLPARLIDKVEFVGNVEQQCIAVDSPEHLYVTRDYIVTHNTYTSLAFSVYDRQMGRSKKHCTVVPKSVLANWYMESKKMLGGHDGVLFVGFEPKRNKNGGIVTEPVLDENNKPKVNQHTGQIEYQDVLVEDSPAEVFAKMHSIPAMAGGLVIMTQEKFKIIPLKPETVEAYGSKWVERSMTSAAAAEKLAGKDVKSGSYAKKKQEAGLEQHYYEEGTAKKDELPYFEDMGFDRVVVDEAHHYKASFQIKEGMDKLAYLPNPAESQRAQDMALKLSHVRDQNGGKGSILLTATPVANSPIEIYNMLMHVVPVEEMDKIGIYTPADFVRFFGRIESVQKLLITGEIGDRDGLKGFRNLNILRGLFNRYANMMTARDVDPDGNVLKLPDAQEVKSQCDMTSEQVAAYIELRAEAKKSGNPKNVASGEARPMFAVLRDMDRVTTDVDLYHGTMTFLFKEAEAGKVRLMIDALPPTIERTVIDEETDEKIKVPVQRVMDFSTSAGTITYVAPDVYEFAIASRLSKFGIGYASHPLTPKYTELVKNLKAELAIGGKQLIFTEEKSQHGKLERLLVENLPEDEARIGIINADTASGEKLQEIVDAYTRGDFTIVICNKKAEVGVNLQRGTTAVHHMTLPWNPASIQQRNGRAVRQGNKVAAVRIYYYQAKGSFDEYRLDLLNKKAGWIGALLDKSNTDDDHDNENASSEIEQAALLSDNREEFLANLAAQQAKKDAATKQRQEDMAKASLGQLTAARDFVRTFDSRKAKELAEVTSDLEKARRSLAAAESLPEDADKAKLNTVNNRKASVARLERKLAGTGPMLDGKLADAEARIRQVSSTLRGQASRNELPFSAALIDNPESALMTLSKLVVAAGGIYEATTSEGEKVTLRVVAINRSKREVEVEYITKARRGSWDGTSDVDRLLGTGARELHLNDSEIQLLKLLNNEIPYRELANRVAKDVFMTVADKVKIRGYCMQRSNSGGVLSAAYGKAASESTLVYPDRLDKALRKEIAGLYGEQLSGRGGLLQSAQVDVMPAFFGEDWRTGISEYIKTATTEQIREQAMTVIRGKVPAVLATVDECRAAATWLEEATGYYTSGHSGVAAMRDWAAAAGYLNADDAVAGFKQAASAERTQVAFRRQVIERAAREAELAAASAAKEEADGAAKSDPRYRELSTDHAARFRSMGIDARYNNSEAAGQWTPFSGLLLKDTRGVSGILKRVKDMMKPRFSASWVGAKAVVSGSQFAENWGMPARTDVDALLNFLEG